MCKRPHPTLEGTPWGSVSYDASCPDCRNGIHGALMDSTPESDNKTLDALWDALWEDLRRNATGRPSGLLIITKHRAGIEEEARRHVNWPDVRPSWSEDAEGYVVAPLDWKGAK